MKSELRQLFSAVEKSLRQAEQGLAKISEHALGAEETAKLEAILKRQSEAAEQSRLQKANLILFLGHLAYLVGLRKISLGRTDAFEHFELRINGIVPEMEFEFSVKRNGDCPRTGDIEFAMSLKEVAGYSFPFEYLSQAILSGIEAKLEDENSKIGGDNQLLERRAAQAREIAVRFQMSPTPVS